MPKTHNEEHDGYVYEVTYERLRKVPKRGDVIDNGDAFKFLFTGIKRVVAKHEWFYSPEDGVCRYAAVGNDPRWFVIPCGEVSEMLRMIDMSNRHLIDARW